MLTSRRNFLGLLAAPAIVRASSLMRVVPLPDDPWGEVDRIYRQEIEYWKGEWRGIELYHLDNSRFAERFEGGI